MTETRTDVPRRPDPERDRLASTVYAARLLLRAATEGQNLDRLARRLGCSHAFVSRCARRLIENGVWQDGRTVAAWLDEGPDHPSFWYDVAVAQGVLHRRVTESGELEWAPAGVWVRPYERTTKGGAHGWLAHPLRGQGRHGFEVLPGAAAREPSDALARWVRGPGHRGSARPRDPIGTLFPDAVWLGVA